jgi:hypothetical protein
MHPHKGLVLLWLTQLALGGTRVFVSDTFALLLDCLVDFRYVDFRVHIQLSWLVLVLG